GSTRRAPRWRTGRRRRSAGPGGRPPMLPGRRRARRARRASAWRRGGGGRGAGGTSGFVVARQARVAGDREWAAVLVVASPPILVARSAGRDRTNVLSTAPASRRPPARRSEEAPS